LRRGVTTSVVYLTVSDRRRMGKAPGALGLGSCSLGRVRGRPLPCPKVFLHRSFYHSARETVFVGPWSTPQTGLSMSCRFNKLHQNIFLLCSSLTCGTTLLHPIAARRHVPLNLREAYRAYRIASCTIHASTPI